MTTVGQEATGAHGSSHESRDLIVGVRFELSPRKPFAHVYPPSTHVETVLDAAMHHFGVQPDPNTTYYLTAHRERQPGDRTLAEVAGHHGEVEFRMVKELIQGGA
jgi:hypothetical protein